MAEKSRKGIGTALKSSFLTRTFRVGSYSIAASLIVIAIAVAVMLAVGAVPGRYTQFDMTAEGIYSLSEETEKLADSLEEDVELCLLAMSGNEDAQLQALLEQYDALSRHIRVTTVDPVANPGYYQQYTDELRHNNSVLVISGTRSRLVDSAEIYLYDYSNYYSTYDANDIITTFNGEGAITSAIDYVTSDDLPVMYILAGHGETELSAAFAAGVTAQNIASASLSLLTAGRVPEDCDCLLINGPTSDLASEETDMLREYIAGGGKLLLLTGYKADETFPHLRSLMKEYGCALSDSIISERAEGNFFYGYYEYLLPNIQSHAITDALVSAGMYIAVPVAQGILVSEELPENVSVTRLLTTSDQAYIVSDFTAMEKQEGDPEGPFAVGVAIQAGEGQIVWYSSANLLNDSVNQLVSGGNGDLFLNSLNWMCQREDRIAIHAKTLRSEQLLLTSAQTRTLGRLFCIVIPAIVVCAGAAVIVKRRRMR